MSLVPFPLSEFSHISWYIQRCFSNYIGFIIEWKDWCERWIGNDV